MKLKVTASRMCWRDNCACGCILNGFGCCWILSHLCRSVNLMPFVHLKVSLRFEIFNFSLFCPPRDELKVWVFQKQASNQFAYFFEWIRFFNLTAFSVFSASLLFILNAASPGAFYYLLTATPIESQIVYCDISTSEIYGSASKWKKNWRKSSLFL